ncbi:MAG: hypothetical protein REI12_02285 [Pedobacter sp.]|nr:hypothetical protein [Pedobacter sp.]
MPALLAGILAAALCVWGARRLGVQRWAYTLGLLTLPWPYVFFAHRAGDGNTAFMEMYYGMFFLAAGLVFAISRMKFSAYVVALLWLLHGAYDVFHSHLVFNLGTPGWYPLLCAGFDVVIAVSLVWLATRLPDGDILKA